MNELGNVSGLENMREWFQTAVAIAGVLGVAASAFKWAPPLCRWLVKHKQICDKTWPVLVLPRGNEYTWFEGRYGIELPSIELRIEFVLEPRYVPVEIQSVGLNYGGNWFEGIDTVKPSNELSLIGQHLAIKAQTRPYTAVFRIIPPKDAKSGDIATIKAWLHVEVLGLPCIAELGFMHIERKY